MIYHACPNDCLLFEGDQKTCSKCGSERFVNGQPAKLYRYIPVIPQLQRLYAAKHSAEWMRWAGDHTHPSDGSVSDITESLGFREFVVNSSFFDDIRNVVLTLCTDGMNPWDTGTYSVWPLLLSVVNLPPDIRTRAEFFIMAGLIGGHPKHLGPYLKPLIDDVIEFGMKGVNTYDASRKETFEMKFRVLLSLADYPGSAKLYCQKGSGGINGCMKCLIKGQPW